MTAGSSQCRVVRRVSSGLSSRTPERASPRGPTWHGPQGRSREGLCGTHSRAVSPTLRGPRRGRAGDGRKVLPGKDPRTPGEEWWPLAGEGLVKAWPRKDQGVVSTGRVVAGLREDTPGTTERLQYSQVMGRGP